jgi:hypothetical protein
MSIKKIYRSYNRGNLPFSLKAVGKTSLLMEPQGKRRGNILASSPISSQKVGLVREEVIYWHPLLYQNVGLVREEVIYWHPLLYQNVGLVREEVIYWHPLLYQARM